MKLHFCGSARPLEHVLHANVALAWFCITSEGFVRPVLVIPSTNTGSCILVKKSKLFGSTAVSSEGVWTSNLPRTIDERSPRNHGVCTDLARFRARRGLRIPSPRLVRWSVLTSLVCRRIHVVQGWCRTSVDLSGCFFSLPPSRSFPFSSISLVGPLCSSLLRGGGSPALPRRCTPPQQMHPSPPPLVSSPSVGCVCSPPSTPRWEEGRRGGGTDVRRWC